MDDAPRELGLVVAYAHDRVIGFDGGMPWHETADLKHFKRVTMGHALLMGRRTHASIGKALPGRRNIVITRQSDLVLPAGCERTGSLEEALASAYATDPRPMVIGGAQIYALALPLVTHLYVTEIDRKVPGDTWFPALDEAAWTEVERDTAEDGRLLFRTLVRQPADQAAQGTDAAPSG